MIIYGINPVLEALRSGRVRRLRVGPRGDRRIEEALALARAKGVAIERVDARHDRSGGARRRAPGDRRRRRCAARLQPRGARRAAAPAAPLIVVLDGIEDPHNVGAILRTVDAAGAHGVVRQARHAAALDGVAAKASAGAVAHVPIATEVNIARAIEELKDARRLDGGPRRRCAGAHTTPSISRCRRPWSSARRAPGFAGSCGSDATGWCRFRCTERSAA